MHVPQGVSISILITTVMPEEVTTTVENYQDACRNGKMETIMCVGCVFVVRDHLHYKVQLESYQ